MFLTLAATAWFIWADASGGVHATNVPESVPARERARAVELEPRPWACYARLSTSDELAGACTDADEAPLVLPEPDR